MRIFCTFLVTAFVGSASAGPLTFEGSEGPGKGKHIVLVSGDEEYRSEETLPQLAKILATHHGFKCTVLFAIDPKTGDIDPGVSNIPGLEALKSADAMVMFLRFRDLPDDQMKYIADYLSAGKPIIGLRTSTHAFKVAGKKTYADWSFNAKDGGFGKKILGETWVNHHGGHGKQATRGILAKDEAKNPILRGIADGDIFGPSDVYTVKLPLTSDAKTLVYGQVVDGMLPTDKPFAGPKNEPMMPVAWTKPYQYNGGTVGKVFTTTMGCSQDLENEGFRRLLVNATYWAADLAEKIPEKSKVDIVGTFKATPFKAGGHTKGLKPESFEK